MAESDSDKKPATPSVPSWQRVEPEEKKVAKPATTSSPAPTETPTETKTETETKNETEKSETEKSATDSAVATPSAEDKLEVARKFLDDEHVRDAPREKKIEFLKSKDIPVDDIQTLLGDEPEPSVLKPREDTLTHPPAAQSTSTQTSSTSTPASKSESTPMLPTSPADRAPVVTYPEFMAKPSVPPPLVTTNGLLNTLYAVVGLSTLVYGTSKSVVQPMVQAQTDARTEYLDTTKRNLDAIVAKLEKTVSVVPPTKQSTQATVEEESEAEDPSEMFHRDMGTQTSSPFPFGIERDDKKKETDTDAATRRQVDVLTKLNKSLSNLKDGNRSQSEELTNLLSNFDEFNTYLDSLTYTPSSAVSFDVYGRTRKNEPKDGIRQVKEQVRLIKGIMLSTRNFPNQVR